MKNPLITLGFCSLLLASQAQAKDKIFDLKDIKTFTAKVPKALRIAPVGLPPEYQLVYLGWLKTSKNAPQDVGYVMRVHHYRQFQYTVPDTFLEKKQGKPLAKRVTVSPGATQYYSVSLFNRADGVSKLRCAQEKGEIKTLKHPKLGKGTFCFTPRVFSYLGIEDPKRTTYDPRFFKQVDKQLHLQGVVIRPLWDTDLAKKGIYINGVVVDEADFTRFFKSLKRVG